MPGERTTTKKEIPVAIRPGDPPVPIPNTKVKPREADDTAGTRESRWPPELEKRIRKKPDNRKTA